MSVSKTPVSIIQEMCAKVNISPPVYELVSESGEPHNPTFVMKVTLSQLNWEATGTARVKKDAKHRAAENLMRKIASAEELPADDPNRLNANECICLMKLVIVDENYETVNKDSGPNGTAGLREWCFDNNIADPEYEITQVEGPVHDPLFHAVCSLLGFRTEGSGRSKKIARKMAAEKMLRIVQSENVQLPPRNSEDIAE